MSDASDKRAEQIKEYARQYAEEAIDALRDVFTDEQQKGAARAVAAKTLLERGFGAAERRIEQKVDVTVVDQRQAHFEALQRLAARKAPLQITQAQDDNKDDIQDAQFEEVKGSKNDN